MNLRAARRISEAVDQSVLVLLIGVIGACGGGDDGLPAADGGADSAQADGDASTEDDAGPSVDDLCAPQNNRIELDLLVDGYPVRTCTESWRLNIRACGDEDDPLCNAHVCGACSGDIDDGCDLGDACVEPSFPIGAPGTYTVCVEAELINGGIDFEQCGEIEVSPEGPIEALAIDVDTDSAFPCIRDWVYDPEEDMCCDYNVGYCAPPGFGG